MDLRQLTISYGNLGDNRSNISGMIKLKTTLPEGGFRIDIDTMKKFIYPIAIAYEIKKITLFDSRADNTNHPDSDIDLCVE